MTKTWASTSGGSAGIQIYAGSYTGDGNATLAIIDCPFQPRFLTIWARDAAQAYDIPFTFKDDNDGVNTHICNNGLLRFIADQVISLDATGFTVGDGTGSTNYLNIVGQVYTYMAWS